MFRKPTIGAGAMAGIAALIWTTSSTAHGYRWGVFREQSFFGTPLDYRRCRIQEIGPAQLIPGKLLARAATLSEAVSSYHMLIALGRCAP